MEKLNITGILTLEAVKNGRVIWKKTEHNLITNDGYNIILNAIAGNADSSIAKIQAGTNGTAASVTDTAITNPLNIPISEQTISGKKLTLRFIMDETMGNGTTFAEFGTIGADDRLFSRKAWPAFTKIAELVINGTWEINL